MELRESDLLQLLCERAVLECAVDTVGAHGTAGTRHEVAEAAQASKTTSLDRLNASEAGGEVRRRLSLHRVCTKGTSQHMLKSECTGK